MSGDEAAADTAALLGEIASTGRDRRRGGWSRHLLDDAERGLRDWFTERAGRCGLDVETDRNANLWAWWPGPDGGRRGAVATGSHLDSVPGGGAFDGPLGVASALAAVSALRERGVVPARPLAVVAFAEEEGGRFGIPCLGSSLATGAVDPAAVLDRTDPDGATLADALAAGGVDPRRVGPDPDRLALLDAFVELHVEQGRGLAGHGAAVGLGSSIIGHGRWRLRVRGRGDHAGSTLLADRRDPMLPAAHVVLAAREVARRRDVRATVGQIVPVPGGSNVIASAVDVWLDVRADPDSRVDDAVEEIAARAGEAAAAEGCTVELTRESRSPEVTFDGALTDRVAAALDGPARLPTGAGHDAGVLATRLPTAMLFVRNPTGVSHAPDEHAEDADVEAGTRALTRVLGELLS